MALLPSLLSELASQASGRYIRHDSYQTVPEALQAETMRRALDKGLDARVADIAPDVTPKVAYVPTKPDPQSKTSAATNSRIKLANGDIAHKVVYPPEGDAIYLAHELGHTASDSTKIGNFVRDIRGKLQANPHLTDAVAKGIMLTAPAAGAALQEGDDDLLGSIGIAAALASPRLIDEALASKNALAIMDKAGSRASLGQRGKLAAAYLTYLAPVILAGSVGNTLGNVADDYTAIYDL